MKKALLLFLVLPVLLAACALSVADEPPAWRQCGHYRYILLEDGTARIERYSGDEAVIYPCGAGRFHGYGDRGWGFCSLRL